MPRLRTVKRGKRTARGYIMNVQPVDMPQKRMNQAKRAVTPMASTITTHVPTTPATRNPFRPDPLATGPGGQDARTTQQGSEPAAQGAPDGAPRLRGRG